MGGAQQMRAFCRLGVGVGVGGLGGGVDPKWSGIQGCMTPTGVSKGQSIESMRQDCCWSSLCAQPSAGIRKGIGCLCTCACQKRQPFLTPRNCFSHFAVGDQRPGPLRAPISPPPPTPHRLWGCVMALSGGKGKKRRGWPYARRIWAATDELGDGQRRLEEDRRRRGVVLGSPLKRRNHKRAPGAVSPGS